MRIDARVSETEYLTEPGNDVRLSSSDNGRRALLFNHLLPRGSPIRQKLRRRLREFSYGIPSGLRQNWTEPTAEALEEIRCALESDYFPSWYQDEHMRDFFGSDQGLCELKEHLYERLTLHRYEFIPWIDSVVRLKGARVLEIGCGTGCASVALGEQGATVVAVDVHHEGLVVSEMRVRAHGLLDNVSFIHANACNITDVVPHERFDLVLFLAVLEHMTFEERKATLRAAWELLQIGKHVCIADTPNKLWFVDSHTSFLPFYHWLSDEVAFEYSRFSPRQPFNKRFRCLDQESILRFYREGRGFSYHELDLALRDESSYRVVSDLMSFLSQHYPAVAVKRVLESDSRREKLLNLYAPERHRGFFRQSVNVVIEKMH